VGPMQLLKFKIIKQYQNTSMIIEKYTKKQCEKTKILPYAKLFLSFPRLKTYFNYLTICEMLKNSWATSFNCVNLGGKIIFLLCK
jgi:hypothetical protein